MIELLAANAEEFATDKSYGKLVHQIVPMLGPALVRVEEELRSILEVHKTVWKAKLQKSVVQCFENNASFSQSFRWFFKLKHNLYGMMLKVCFTLLQLRVHSHSRRTWVLWYPPWAQRESAIKRLGINSKYGKLKKTVEICIITRAAKFFGPLSVAVCLRN